MPLRRLLSVFLLVLLSSSLTIFSSAAAADASVCYHLLLRRLDPHLEAALTEGTPLIDRVGKYPLGTVIAVKKTPHMQETYARQEDKLVTVPHPYYRDVTLTVRTEGTQKDDALLLGGYTLVCGKTVSFATPTFTGVAECTGIFFSKEIAP